ncbi:MAG: hypothetical protein ACO3JG_14340, partial [Luteolibacter sp.]
PPPPPLDPLVGRRGLALIIEQALRDHVQAADPFRTAHLDDIARTIELLSAFVLSIQDKDSFHQKLV